MKEDSGCEMKFGEVDAVTYILRVRLNLASRLDVGRWSQGIEYRDCTSGMS